MLRLTRPPSRLAPATRRHIPVPRGKASQPPPRAGGGDGAFGAWKDLADFVGSGSGGAKGAFDSLADRIGRDVYIDVAGVCVGGLDGVCLGGREGLLMNQPPPLHRLPTTAPPPPSNHRALSFLPLRLASLPARRQGRWLHPSRRSGGPAGSGRHQGGRPAGRGRRHAGRTAAYAGWWQGDCETGRRYSSVRSWRPGAGGRRVCQRETVMVWCAKPKRKTTPGFCLQKKERGRNQLTRPLCLSLTHTNQWCFSPGSNSGFSPQGNGLERTLVYSRSGLSPSWGCSLARE